MSAYLEEYLEWGGFPEVVLAQTPELKRHRLQSYVDTMLLRDVVDRHEIKNVALGEKLFTKALLSFTATFSVHKWYNDFKSQGLKLSKDTFYEYLHHLEESLFLIILQNQANTAAAKKIYLVDNRLYHVVRNKPDRGRLCENACFLELRRQQTRVGFWLDDQGEIDFVTDTQCIQATLGLHADNREREWGSLERLARNMPGRETEVWIYPKPFIE